MQRIIHVAIYARVSTADGRQDTENQLAELRWFASTQGWEIVVEYIDHESGGRADRAEFRHMFADAGQRKFDLVLVWALDRFTREGVAETFEYIKRLTLHGVQFVSFTEEHFRTTGPAGELMIAVAAWIAKQERTRISERVRAGLSRAKAQGTRSGNAVGRPKAMLDRQKVADLRNQGRSWREIARACNAGVTTVRRAYGVVGSIPNASGVPKSPE
jgi:DNA invertase Pin-like site-specific DNA recombinase